MRAEDPTADGGSAGTRRTPGRWPLTEAEPRAAASSRAAAADAKLAGRCVIISGKALLSEVSELADLALAGHGVPSVRYTYLLSDTYR
jgi:hypothetical protein